MTYATFPQLIQAYLNHLMGRPKHPVLVRTAREWINHQTTIPTRRDVLTRQAAKQHVPAQANSELSLLRAACNWGIDQEVWEGGNPTIGIRKFKTHKRREICKHEQLKALVGHWQQARSLMAMRDRALFGLMLLTGCRPSELRGAKLGAIVPYGTMGCWRKPTTKTGEPHEIPVPSQGMAWLRAWMAVRALTDGRGNNPYVFPGLGNQEPLAEASVRLRWKAVCATLGIQGLWNYDLRRTMASYLGNELHYDDKTIQAVLNHHDGRAISHYYHVSFDALCTVIQHYAEWVCGLGARPSTVPRQTERVFDTTAEPSSQLIVHLQ